MKTTFSLAALFAVTCASVSGCITDKGAVVTPESGTPVVFSTAIAKTRAYDNMWQVGDRIGVYMLPTSSSQRSDGTSVRADNKQYGHKLSAEGRNAVFEGIGDDVIMWPEDGSRVDFTAYYPYRESISDLLYPVNIATQDPHRNIDLLYSNDATDKTASSGSPALTFEHVLTKLVFNVTDIGGASLEGMTATIEGLSTTATFNLATGAIVAGSTNNKVPFQAILVSTSVSGNHEGGKKDKAVVEAIVLPGQNIEYTITFALQNGESAVFTEDNIDYLEPGSKYVYNISLNPLKESIAFGDLSSIDNWTEVAGGSGNIDKTGRGEPWDSKLFTSITQGYSVAGGSFVSGEGYLVANGTQMTISKSDYTEGIASVTVRARKNGSANSGDISVTVDGVSFNYGAGGVNAPITSTSVEDYVFTAPEGTPAFGNIAIAVRSTSGPMYAHSFKIN